MASAAAAECHYPACLQISLGCLRLVLQQNVTTMLVYNLFGLPEASAVAECDYPVCYLSGLPEASAAAECDYPVCYFSGLTEAGAAA